MITVTRLNGKPIVVNAEMIRSVEENPDTTITLINGDHIIVQEKMDLAEVTHAACVGRTRPPGPRAGGGPCVPAAPAASR
ncbi:MAG: flagellar FlbD family protein [Planctomycetota bacterium]